MEEAWRVRVRAPQTPSAALRADHPSAAYEYAHDLQPGVVGPLWARWGEAHTHLFIPPQPLRHDHGRVVQVEPIKPTLKAPGINRFKLTRDERLSNFAFKSNLRHYITARQIRRWHRRCGWVPAPAVFSKGSPALLPVAEEDEEEVADEYQKTIENT